MGESARAAPRSVCVASAHASQRRDMAVRSHQTRMVDGSPRAVRRHNASVGVRVFDVSVATVALILTAPLMATIAALVGTTSRGGVIYRSERLGSNGRRFDAFKFRTMCDGADRQLDDLLTSDSDLLDEYHRFHKLARDPRVTPVGRVLRRHSLDELPQLWNVIRGEMSIVGPRPKLPEEAAIYGRDLATILSVRPGCTGLWQVNGRAGIDVRDRVEIDLRYVDNRSLRSDVGICVQTLGIMVRPDPAEAM